MQFIRDGAVRADVPAAPVADYSTPAAGIPPDFRGIIPYRVRPLTLLDLIPTGTTDSNSVEYVKVTGRPSGAVETAELATKAATGLQTTDATAPVRTIAAYMKMSRQSMDDQAGVVTIVNGLLPYEVRRRIEAQILAGDGVGQNIRGILNTSGIASPAATAGDNAADAILRGITTLSLSDRDANFVAANPTDMQALLLTKATTGEYIYGAPGGVSGSYTGATVWGLTMTPSRIVTGKAPLVGDSAGCTILVREGINVKTSDSDQDDFVKNRVTILAETRLAFPVWYPVAFCVAAIP
jgi:HK97 family phage major capsid protein